MKKIIKNPVKFLFSFLTLLFCFTSLAQAQKTDRFAVFDEMNQCKEQGGNWREFGNGCADSCLSKINTLPICTTTLTYSCDCGKNLCWNNNKCISIEDYKIIAAKEAEELEKIRAESEEKDKTVPQEKSGLGSVFSGRQKVFDYTKPKENGSDSILPAIPTMTEIQEDVKNTTNDISETLDTSQIKIPPAFLEMEQKIRKSIESEAESKENAQAKQAVQEVAKDVQNGAKINNSSTTNEPAFPSALPIPSSKN